MSIPSADEFLKKIAADPELAAKVKSAIETVPPAEIPSALAAIATQEGFAITVDDLTQDLKKPLSEEELHHVSAGSAADPGVAPWNNVLSTVAAATYSNLAAFLGANLYGQKEPAITANEATYAQTWAQDAAAMNGYKP